MNKVILCGNLGHAPELRHTQSGAAVANLSMATTERWMDKSGQKQERTEWHKIVVWGKSGEFIAQYAQKGSKVLVEGKITTRKYQDKAGQDRYITEIQADRVELLSSSNAAKNTQAAGNNSYGEDAGGGGEFTEDDIPF